MAANNDHLFNEDHWSYEGRPERTVEAEELDKYWNLLSQNFLYEPKTGLDHYFLGLFYLAQTDPEDIPLAARHFAWGAELGHRSAILELAKYYLFCDNGPMAVRWLERAQQAGLILCPFYQGKLHEGHKNYSEMKSCYLLGVKNRCSPSAMALCNYYWVLQDPPDKLRCLQYANLAIEWGNYYALESTYFLFIHSPELVEERFLWAARHWPSLRDGGLDPEPLLKVPSISKAVIHAMLSLSNNELLYQEGEERNYLWLKRQYLEYLQLDFYTSSSYFSFYMTKDVFTHVLLPYLNF